MNTVPKSVREPIVIELRECEESLTDLEHMRETIQRDLDKNLANIARQNTRRSELATWLANNKAE